MRVKTRNIRSRRKIKYNLIIIFIIAISALQFWNLKAFYKEIKFELPKNLFKSQISLPISEITVGKEIASVNVEKADALESSGTDDTSTTGTAKAANATESTETTLAGSENVFELSDAQKKIILRLMKLPEENIVYAYKAYPETGYPDEPNWISTDVVSVVLKDCGYDLMELIHKDMSEHIEAYPMDKKGSKNLDKKSDFRVVYFQQKFFQRNALELPVDFNPDDPTNVLQWQPGDIVYFEIDPENPGKDVAGMVSNHKNDKGIPLIIMITKDLGKVSEVDNLSTLKVSGHFRYPYPELNQ
ncbi:MAG: DUF1287 domain-containing protein [Actinomycetota bacterium]|nr:DUF1287 domain-containing protein [Actinomycetota bacterium]